MARKTRRTGLNGKTLTRDTAVFNIRLHRDILAHLRVQASKEQRSVTNLVQVIISEGLQRRGANA
jgi:hypothetical protein